MLNLVKKAVFTGVGLGLMTKESIEELAREVGKEARLSEKEGKELVDELVSKSEQAKINAEAKVESIVRKVVAKLNLVSAEELSQLAARVEQLEKKHTPPA